MGKAAEDYLREWRGKGYTGNYIPERLREADVEADAEKMLALEAWEQELMDRLEEEIVVEPEDEAQVETLARSNNFVTGFAVMMAPDGSTLIVADLSPEQVQSLTVDRNPSPDEVRRMAHDVYEFEAHRRIAAFVAQTLPPPDHTH